jgi:hypothetical protein
MVGELPETLNSSSKRDRIMAIAGPSGNPSGRDDGEKFAGGFGLMARRES